MSAPTQAQARPAPKQGVSEYAKRVRCAFFGGILATCGLINALAVLVGADPIDSRWNLSQAAAGLGIGLMAAARVRRDGADGR